MVRNVREHELAQPEAADPWAEERGPEESERVVLTEPVRAWLIRACDDTTRRCQRPSSSDVDSLLWKMFLEGGRDTVDLAGLFEELVARAVAAGVVEFHVWSRSQRTYLPFSPMTVRVPD